MFYLQCPSDCGAPNQRSLHAHIGHATSSDLDNWIELPPALSPGPDTGFDDISLGAGCVVDKPAGGWRMFYTGITRSPYEGEHAAYAQAISWADSDDGIRFVKGQAQILLPDIRWYHSGSQSYPHVTMKDPFVFHYGDMWHMYFCTTLHANACSGNLTPENAAVIGYATSPDLDIWLFQPPIITPGFFYDLHLVQAHNIAGKSYLLISATHKEGKHGVWLIPGESMLGPWECQRARPIVYDDVFGGRLFRNREGQWFYNGYTSNAPFVGTIAPKIAFNDLHQGAQTH